jgi:hypothetical protein
VRLAPLTLCLLLLAAACDGTSSPAPPLDPPSVDTSPSGGCSEIEVGGSVAKRFEVNGSCLAGDVMVLYRCSPTAVPVLRISSVDGPALFLGGPFAVPVSTLPAQVRFAGHARGGTDVLIADPIPPSPAPSLSVSESPSAEGGGVPAPQPEPEPLVFVREGGVTERWLRLRGRRALQEPPILWIIGDSILDGGRDDVEAAFTDWSLTLDAEVGRSSSTGVALAQAAAEQDADAVVIELGTNDPSADEFRSHLVETLDLLKGVPFVIWQTARGPDDDSSIPEVNEAIRDVVPTYPNVAIADWASFVPDEAVQTDGIHPDEGFQQLEAELLTPMLTEWRDALSREGATSCGRSMVSETS